MKTQSVYIEVPVSERLPEQDSKVEFVIYGKHKAKGTLHPGVFKDWNAQFWLEKKEGYFFTKEDFETAIKEAQRVAFGWGVELTSFNQLPELSKQYLANL